MVLEVSIEKMSSPVIEQIVAPRRKEDYVQAIACRCKVPVESLRMHTVDRLKELYAVLKPKKRSEILPVGWKSSISRYSERYMSRRWFTTFSGTRTVIGRGGSDRNS